MTIRILIDSSVWLDILENARLDPVLTAIEDLVAVEAISLILPEQIVFEFNRNKDRVKDARKNTLIAAVKRFREALSQIDSEAERAQALQVVSAIDHKLALTADTSEKVTARITELMKNALMIAVSDGVKLKAADRSLARAAPCHQRKNSIADAIILEAYIEAMTADGGSESQFVFVTTNTNDFSATAGDKRLPHPDLESLFVAPKSSYSTQITEVIRNIDETRLNDYTFGDDFYEQPRMLSELLEAEHLLSRQIWYNRHRDLRRRIGSGETRLVDAIDLTQRPITSLLTLDTWEAALQAAKRTEDEVGLENLGTWTDFEWGMLNGKLSALGWVLGNQWDMLDT